MIDIDSVILSSRARIARNLPEHKFTVRCSSKEKSLVAGFLKKNLNIFLDSRGLKFLMLRGLKKTNRGLLLEKNIISKEMNKKVSGRGILIDEFFKSPVSVMINEEDHVRIQSLVKGFSLDRTFDEVVDIEKELEKRLVFAFDEEFGYLASCPTNIGTGLRLSVMAHLPGLILNSEIAEFIEKINKIGYGVRGYLGEDSEIIGNVFQIYNKKALGMSEKDLLEETKSVVMNTYEEEKSSIEKLLKESPKIVEDNIYRSYGMVKYAKLLNFEEAVELVSMIKLGRDTFILDNIRSFDHYHLLVELGRNHIIDKINKRDNIEVIEDEDIEAFRARYLREKLLKKDLI